MQMFDLRPRRHRAGWLYDTALTLARSAARPATLGRRICVRKPRVTPTRRRRFHHATNDDRQHHDSLRRDRERAGTGGAMILTLWLKLSALPHSTRIRNVWELAADGARVLLDGL